jgi:hypothetical protein
MILLNVVNVLNSVTAFKRFRKTARSNCYFHHVRLSSRNNSAPTERIFMKFNIWLSLENLPKNSSFIKILLE